MTEAILKLIVEMIRKERNDEYARVKICYELETGWYTTVDGELIAGFDNKGDYRLRAFTIEQHANNIREWYDLTVL